MAGGSRLSSRGSPELGIYSTCTARGSERYLFSRYCSLAGLLSKVVSLGFLESMMIVDKLKGCLCRPQLDVGYTEFAVETRKAISRFRIIRYAKQLYAI
jgi:hypothetical protein